MKENQKPAWVWGSGSQIAPHQLRIYPLRALGGSALVGALVFLASFSLLSIMPPNAIPATPGAVALACLKIILWAASKGHLFPSAGPFNLHALSTGASIAKALGALGLAALASKKIWSLSTVPRDGYEHVRGTRMHTGKAAEKIMRAVFAGEKMRLIWPGVAKTSPVNVGNGYLVLGSPGSGKTSIILPYVAGLMADGEKLLSLDVKNEQAQKLGPKAHILAPWREGSLYLDISRDVTTKSQAQMLADILIPVPESGKDKIWQAAANAVGAALILDLVETKPQKWNWTDLANQLDKTVEEWAALMPPNTAKILQGAAETSASVAFNVVTELQTLRAVADMFDECKRFGGKPFSVRGWLEKKNYPVRQVILCYSDAYEKTVGFLIPFIVNYIAKQIEWLPNNTSDPKHIILDEFAQLPMIAMLPKLYEIGRSKGFCTLLAVQDWQQVKEKYGENRAGVIFSNATIKIIARTSASHAQKELAELMGTHEVAILSQSMSSGNGSGAPSVSQTYQEKTIPHVMPGELESNLGPHSFKTVRGSMRPTKIRALLRKDNGDLFTLDWPIVDFPELRAEPAPLPSHYANAELVRKHLRDAAGEPLGLAVRAAYKVAGMTARELAALLYSDRVLTVEQWKQAQKNADQLLNSLPTVHDEEAPGGPATPTQETPATLAQVREVEPAQHAQAHPMMAPTMRDERPSIDDLITSHRDANGAQVFEGLKPEEQPRPAAEAEALTDLASLAALDKLSGHAQAVEVGKIVIETLDALEEKQAPEAVQTAIGGGGDDEELARMAKNLAKLRRHKSQQ